jgi:hypothetical protein
MMPHPDGLFLRPPNPDDEDERRATWEDELDLARLFEERVDAISSHGGAAPFDDCVHDRAQRDVYGTPRREEVHDS